jgi:hypothetical protein
MNAYIYTYIHTQGLRKEKLEKVKRIAESLREKEGRPEADCCICMETLDQGMCASTYVCVCEHMFTCGLVLREGGKTVVYV